MVNYQKYITVMQLALGVTASNKEHCLPPRKRMWLKKGLNWYQFYIDTESICDGSAPHLTMTQLRVGRCGAQIWPDPLRFLSPKGNCGLLKSTDVSTIFLVGHLRLASGTLSCCDTTMSFVCSPASDVVLSSFSVSYLLRCADPRHHPSPTAGSVTAASSASTGQGKPSLRRIKGRIHRSKSLDSIDLLDSNSGEDFGSQPTPAVICVGKHCTCLQKA
ncbi:unnamed protein product [Menidia menidia]|uniref:(Atlantic silverside) hypothetical protein n=1 Tax=Menidia menidia TaxID=238744 RepID=A0A8S4BIS3_9TELE|nr:unnamed protein product [Menidia menidia]